MFKKFNEIKPKNNEIVVCFSTKTNKKFLGYANDYGQFNDKFAGKSFSHWMTIEEAFTLIPNPILVE